MGTESKEPECVCGEINSRNCPTHQMTPEEEERILTHADVQKAFDEYRETLDRWKAQL